MGFATIVTEKAVLRTRLLAGWSMLVGIGVIFWAITDLPWTRLDPKPGDWVTVTTPAHGSNSNSEADGLTWAHPPSAGTPTNEPVKTSIWIYESGTAAEHIKQVGVLSLLPGAVLFLLAWRMSRLELWAHLATIGICFGYLFEYLFSIVTSVGSTMGSTQSPLLAETLLRPFAIYLLAYCLNALPEARDEYRIRRGRRKHYPRGFEPVMLARPTVTTPPRPTVRPLSSPRKP